MIGDIIAAHYNAAEFMRTEGRYAPEDVYTTNEMNYQALVEMFKRGTKVNYLGGRGDFGDRPTPKAPVKGTYVWAYLAHDGLFAFIIEHPDGYPKEHFMSSAGFKDGFESIRSSLLNDGLLYIYAQPNEIELA